MIDNFFANSYMHLPGQTISNIDQDVNLIKNNNNKAKGKKGKGKGRKAKERATTTTTTTRTTTTTTPTTTNNNNHAKENQKEKVPLGATTTTPARVRKSRATRTTPTTKKRESLLRQPRHQSAGYVASLDIELPLVGSTTRRTSTTFSSNNYHLINSGLSFRAHQISPSHTCLQRASLPSTSSSYHSNNLSFSINRYDKHYLLPQHHHLRVLATAVAALRDTCRTLASTSSRE